MIYNRIWWCCCWITYFFIATRQKIPSSIGGGWTVRNILPNFKYWCIMGIYQRQLASPLRIRLKLKRQTSHKESPTFRHWPHTITIGYSFDASKIDFSKSSFPMNKVSSTNISTNTIFLFGPSLIYRFLLSFVLWKPIFIK